MPGAVECLRAARRPLVLLGTPGRQQRARCAPRSGSRCSPRGSDTTRRTSRTGRPSRLGSIEASTPSRGLPVNSGPAVIAAYLRSSGPAPSRAFWLIPHIFHQRLVDVTRSRGGFLSVAQNWTHNPAARLGGFVVRPPKWPARRVADAVFCLLRSGRFWRTLPREHLPQQANRLLPLRALAPRRPTEAGTRSPARGDARGAGARP